MNNVPEQLVATNKENLETVIAFAGITAAGAEKLIELQLRTAKNVFADAVKNAKALAAVKDVQELTEIQSSIAQPLADKITTFPFELPVAPIVNDYAARAARPLENSRDRNLAGVPAR